MRVSSLGWVVVLLAGCSGKNVVAGKDKTTPEELSDSVPAWCASTCERLRSCKQTCDCSSDTCDCVGVDANCEAQCASEMAKFTHGDELCAEAGQRFEQCVDRLECADLGGKDPCPLTESERSACRVSGSDTDSSGPNGGSADPTSPAGSPGPNGASAGGPAGPAVTCNGETSSSRPTNIEAPRPAVECEGGRNECSDGHNYDWMCAVGSDGQRACTCFVDSQVMASFAPGPDECPTLSQVNAGCAWNLAEQ